MSEHAVTFFVLCLSLLLESKTLFFNSTYSIHLAMSGDGRKKKRNRNASDQDEPQPVASSSRHNDQPLEQPPAKKKKDSHEKSAKGPERYRLAAKDVPPESESTKVRDSLCCPSPSL
jgi:hypothetical protein